MSNVDWLIKLTCLLTFYSSTFTSLNGNCGQSIYVLQGDTCHHIRSAFQLSPDKFEQLNGNVDCTRLNEYSSRICVASRSDQQAWTADQNRPCAGPFVTVMPGDTCAKIGNRLHVDQTHFNLNNPNIDCDHLSPGETICGAPQGDQAVDNEYPEETGFPPLSRQYFGVRNGSIVGGGAAVDANPNEMACENGQLIEIERGETCQSIASRYRIPLAQFQADNVDIDCDYLSSGVSICIRSSSGHSTSAPNPTDSPQEKQTSSNFTNATLARCPGRFVKAKGDETCSNLRQQHSISSDQQFAGLNPHLNCSGHSGNIRKGAIVCIGKPRVVYADLQYKKRRGIENIQALLVHCTEWYRVKSGDTCWSVRSVVKLNEKDFLNLNPGLDCSWLKVEQRICLRNGTVTGKPCRWTYAVQNGQTCDSVAELAKLNVDQLKLMNPKMDCNRLEEKMQICLSVDDPFQVEKHETAADRFLQTAAGRLGERSVIDANTAKTIQQLLSGGVGQTVAESHQLIDALAKKESIGLIKAVTQANANFRRLSSEFDQRRGVICTQLTAGPTVYSQCVCDTTKPFIHCQAILLKNLRSDPGKPGRHRRRHSKRQHQSKRTKRLQWNISQQISTSRFISSTTARPNKVSKATADVSKAFTDFWKFFQTWCPNCLEEGCLAIGACFIIPAAPVFQICAWGGGCFPNPAMLITTGNRLTVNQFFSSQVNLGVGVCITGIHTVFKLVGMDACVASVDFRYYYLRQQLELHPQIALVAVRSYLDALVQVGNSITQNLYDSENNIPLADLCLEEAYQCNDFCQLDKGEVVVKYNVEVWWFGWRSVKSGDVKGLPPCQPKVLPPPATLKRLVVFVTDGHAEGNTSRPDHCKLHDNPLKYIRTDMGITHVVLGPVRIDPRTFRLIESDQDGKMDVEKSGKIKLMISVGGRAFCEDNTTKTVFPNMAKSSENRKTFVDSAMDYIKKKSLNGIDIGWVNVQPEDADSYLALIREIRRAIDTAGGGLQFSITLAPTNKTISTASIHQKVDFINLMTLDYHEAGDGYQPDGINVHSPVVDCSCSEKGDIELTVEDYLNEGVPANKLNLGLSTFGRPFKLDEHWQREDQSAGRVSGECTKTPGLLAWYEIKNRVDEIRIDNKTMSAYASYGTFEWVGFDNEETHNMKLCLARYKLLGGVAVWEANYDDNWELIESIGRAISTPATHNCSNVQISKCDDQSDTEKKRSFPVEDRARASASKPAKPNSSNSGSSSTPTCSSSAPADSKKCGLAICTSPPSVVNGDKQKMGQCANKQAGSACTIRCLPGYETSALTPSVACVRLFSSFAIWLPSAKCQPTEETRRLCGGDGQSPVTPVFPNSTSSSSSSIPLYIVKFDKGTKMPKWSVYLSEKSTGSQGGREYRFTRYHCHKEDQISTSQFSNLTNHVKSQLVPQLAFVAANNRRATNFMINIAAQERTARYGPWKVLEERVHSFGQTYPAIVVTGVCPVTTDNPSNQSQPLPIPVCFWKMVCVKTGQGAGSAVATVGVFYHENTGALEWVTAASRIQQIKTIRDQSFLIQKMGSNAVSEIWTSTKQWFKGTLDGRGFPSTEECSGRVTMGNEERQFWQRLIEDSRYGRNWAYYDEEGARNDDEDIDDEVEGVSEEYLAYGIRRQPYERCGRVINGQRKK